MKMSDYPVEMSATTKAQFDYREGDGCQESNPYNKETDPLDFDDYAWEMHRLWHESYTAELQLAHSERIAHR